MGGEKIKNKDQLSLAEASVEAELGNNFELYLPVTYTTEL